jgi:X-X-X-Leu-X-X-Gly heptad repeat protein
VTEAKDSGVKKMENRSSDKLQFHSGLSKVRSELHSGLSKLHSGLSELHSGLNENQSELHSELHSQWSEFQLKSSGFHVWTPADYTIHEAIVSQNAKVEEQAVTFSFFGNTASSKFFNVVVRGYDGPNLLDTIEYFFDWNSAVHCYHFWSVKECACLCHFLLCS